MARLKAQAFRKWFDEETYLFRTCTNGDDCYTFQCDLGEFLVTKPVRFARMVRIGMLRFDRRIPHHAQFKLWSTSEIRKQYRAKRRHW